MFSSLLFIGFNETILILIVILILFGAKRMPQMARMLGKGVSEFKKAANDIKQEIEDAAESDYSKKKDSGDENKENRETK
ncbi:MAG: twin-arginine translocase TatA/TatE family subunit [Bacteroidales bacterium]|jgi:TatA/E family protein of Tat protein translocase|nr:twin-arginine translocase TatA/TatE family subunit [Bacteroidales bacterium]